MINNRQGGRRRGRGGQQPRGIAGNNSGNRQDNRQRGNAAQLLEKYKSMARDSQLAGDRVQTEYYLQFADHYFRVLGDSRPRADEQQRPQRGDDDGYDEDGGEDRMDAELDGESDNDGDSDDQQPQQQSQRPRSDEQQQRSRPRPGNDRASGDRGEPRRERPSARPRDDEEGRGRPQSRDNGSERIDFAVLPPAIGSDDSKDFAPADEDEEVRPKRRIRRPRTDETGSDDAAAS